MKKIRRLLIANRGEIALRIMRTAQEMGIQTIAIYSEADRDALHVRMADEAFLIGPPPANQSYLLGDQIIQLCLDHNIDAIHPGYGFLSENAAFTRKVTAAGITFVGPNAESMELMGDKISAKQTVKGFDVPLVPGLDEAIDDREVAKAVAVEIGFPVLIKAAAGGGGKGMRIVENIDEFESQMDRAMSEALSSFGDSAVFVEKYVAGPRHIEIQVLADHHGNVVHLFERECSVQRRHQKVIEEAPSSVLSPELRKQMGEAAVNVCRACKYHNAGTVEFLLDENHNFYFLEINTRLQVEHPVSELITGLDLVREQLLVAEGHPLSFTQDDLEINGHAVELRVYAEDPANNFLPSVGTLSVYHRPTGEGVRLDDAYEQGMEIPIYYDPMIAKLITYGPDRETAIQRMIQAIDDYHIVGVETTLGFGRYVMEHEAFTSGNFDTHFVKNHFTPEDLDRELTADEQMLIAMVSEAALERGSLAYKAREAYEARGESRWKLKR